MKSGREEGRERGRGQERKREERRHSEDKERRVTEKGGSKIMIFRNEGKCQLPVALKNNLLKVQVCPH